VRAKIAEPAETRQSGVAPLRVDSITASVRQAENRKSEDFVALRKGLGYCWSVAVAALPGEGKRLMEKWLVDADRDARWIMKENLKKNRLARVSLA